MRGIIAGAVGVFFATIVGCGPGKKLPDAPPQGKGTTPAEESVRVPSQSEAAARRVVERCLSACSEGHVTRIEQIKAFKSSARGKMKRLVGGEMVLVDTTRDIEVKWPNACRVKVLSPNMQPFDMGLRRPVIWVREGTELKTIPDPKHYEEVAAIDLVGQYWLPALMPLTGAKTVAFDAVRSTAGGGDTIRVSVPGYPVFTLTVTEAGLLTGINYENIEIGSLIRKEILLAGHKPFAGVTLPTEIVYARNGDPVEKWTVTKWEFVDAIDDSVFDPPK